MERFETIYGLLLTLAVTTQCLSFAHGENSILTRFRENSINPEQSRLRIKRSGNSNQNQRQNCNTWSPWINTHTPRVGDPNDTEQVSQQEMDVFCPPGQGGKVTEISCKDEKGEPFHGNRTGPSHEHFVSCNSPVDGVECVLLLPSFHNCPDMSMQYFCSCSNDTHAITTRTMRYTTQTNKLASSKPGVLSTKTWNGGSTNSVKKLTRTGNDGFSAGQLFVPWWLLYILVTVGLFSTSICTTLCMYKQLLKKLSERKQTRKVHPTAF